MSKNYKHILITVGHNASAVFYNSETKYIIGYEQERFDKIKSSSKWPVDCINEIIKNVDISSSDIHISDWFSNQDLQNKYVDIDHIKLLKKKFNCKGPFRHNHHKLHANSAINFNKEHNGPKDGYSLVIDGFGNDGQCITLFSYEDNLIKEKEFSRYSYKFSLGLLYQYAIGFLGMKENQDEYKLLGYESHIKKEQKKLLKPLILKYKRIYCDGIINSDQPIKTKKLIPINLLNDARESVYSMLSDVENELSDHIENKRDKTIVIAHFVQSLLEEVVEYFITILGLSDYHLCLSGGVFYNVKLNNMILNKVNSLCVMPVCGDQGAALGAINSLELGDLKIGVRQVNDKAKTNFSLEEIVSIIMDGGIVNIVDGKMEFGPRALCSTSSIFLPKKHLVEYVNKVNGRDTHMPCAPVVLDKNVRFFFDDDVDSVVGSNKFMIITHDYLPNVDYNEYSGVMHRYPLSNVYSGRPQIIKDENSLIGKILTEVDKLGVKCLVNTSFNVHGHPIVFTHEDAVINHDYQLNVDNQRKNILLYENSF